MQTPNKISETLNPNGAGSGANALKEFQLSGNIQDKTDEKFGEKIILQVEQIINSSYFTERNIRFVLNESMAAGRMNMTKFMDFFNMNGKTNYMNISWKSIMIVNTIISRLVGRWMTKREKAVVEAVDDISIGEKNLEKDKAEFLLYNKDMLIELQNQSGVKMIEEEAFVPDDKDHLDLWAEEEQRIPEEILMEKGINNVFNENGWGDMGVNTRKTKHNSATFGLIGAETIADKNGKIWVNICNPKNSFYSYSDYDDFRDSDIKGEIVSYTLSEIREMFPKLTIKELYDIAKVSKQWVVNNKITFDSGWNTNMYLPFDDWNVDVVRFTLSTLDIDKTLIKTAKDGSLYVDKPKKRIEEVYPGNEYVEKTMTNIYRGIYVRDTKKILYWGLEKNMIRPQDYSKISAAKSPYCFYMYQNTQMRNLAIPEKIEEPVEQMILARLKIQQLVAKMHPSGYKYDIDGLQEMDLGNGIMKPLELQKVTDQTGNVYYRSKDAEGNRIENPITENPNAGSVPQLQALIEVYNYHLQVLRDEIGSNEFSEGQTIKPRVGVQNVQTAMETSFNATDYINDACRNLNDQIAENVACLLHDSVEFGSEEYRSLMNEKDVRKRNFKTNIEILPTTEDITNFEISMNTVLQAQPDLILYLNPEKIKRIARENIKLAEQYWKQGQRRAIKGRAEQAQRQIEDNGRIQTESAVASEKEKQKTLQMEIEMKSQLDMALSKNKQKESLLEMFTNIYSKGLQVPPEWKGIESAVAQNIGMSLFAENKASEQAIEEGMQEENEMQEEQPQQEMQEQAM